MQKKITFGVLFVGSVVLLVSLLFTPMSDEVDVAEVIQQQKQFLPWQVEPTDAGSIRVFGLTLDESTLQDANTLYRGAAEVSLFVAADGAKKVEAYFDKVVLGGFHAQMVMVIGLSPEQLEAMYARGTRVSNLGAGRKKVTLASDDEQTIFFDTPITSLAYLTRARLDEELLQKRFGEPARRIREAKNNTTHWLYPKLGLDVALNDEGRAVLQYVSPKRFDELMAPLLKLDDKSND